MLCKTLFLLTILCVLFLFSASILGVVCGYVFIELLTLVIIV